MTDLDLLDHVIVDDQEVVLGAHHMEDYPEPLEDPGTENICIGCE